VTVLLLRLAGPLQAWGASSRFVRRETRQEPTKSGVLGLLAAAQGRRRIDPIEDLAAMMFGVRVDQPGRLVRDFQTAKSLDGTKTMPLSYRYYLADAVFVAALEADTGLLEGLLEALRNPTFPLYLGRRSCPPAGQVAIGLRDGDITQVLHSEPWQASPWYQRTQPRLVDLPIVLDAERPDEAGEMIRDYPISFDPGRRDYGWRCVTRSSYRVTNGDGTTRSPFPDAPSLEQLTHDPFAALGGT
jgi:CRISPR system Cascade subunit CasD